MWLLWAKKGCIPFQKFIGISYTLSVFRPTFKLARISINFKCKLQQTPAYVRSLARYALERKPSMKYKLQNILLSGELPFPRKNHPTLRTWLCHLAHRGNIQTKYLQLPLIRASKPIELELLEFPKFNLKGRSLWRRRLYR